MTGLLPSGDLAGVCTGARLDSDGDVLLAFADADWPVVNLGKPGDVLRALRANRALVDACRSAMATMRGQVAALSMSKAITRCREAVSLAKGTEGQEGGTP